MRTAQLAHGSQTMQSGVQKKHPHPHACVRATTGSIAAKSASPLTSAGWTELDIRRELGPPQYALMRPKAYAQWKFH